MNNKDMECETKPEDSVIPVDPLELQAIVGSTPPPIDILGKVISQDHETATSSAILERIDDKS